MSQHHTNISYPEEVYVLLSFNCQGLTQKKGKPAGKYNPVKDIKPRTTEDFRLKD